MLASISPLGERARRQHFFITAVSYIVAAALAGAAIGGALGGLGALLGVGFDPVGMIALAVLAVVGFAVDGAWFGLRVPGLRRQVDEDWLTRYRGWVYGAGYGAQLGVGFATIVESMLTWVVFACALLSGPVGGLVVGAVFGFGRGAPLLLTAGIHDPTRLRQFMAAMHRRRRHAQLGARSAELLAAAVLTTLVLV